jgi:cholesterol transport system auxiliary component
VTAWARGATRALASACLLLTACSGLLHSSARPEQIYYLRPPVAQSAPTADTAGFAPGMSDSAAPATMPVSVRVGRPVADPGLESAHIMLLQTDHRMNFYSGSRWPAPAPALIEALAVQTLRASGAWSSVEDSASPFPSDYLLQVHLRRFEAEYREGGGAPEVHVVLDCIIGHRQGREVLATFSASGTASASANHLAQVVEAFEQATGAALEQLAQQAAQTAREDQRRSSSGR